jgi:hypothetical protein
MLSIRSFFVATSFVLATMTVATANGADALPNGKGINVLTLHMQRVTTLENALHKAVNDRDSAALDKLLLPFFEIRRGGGVTVQRDAWLLEGEKSDGELHGLSVYEVGNSAIANFTLVSSGHPDRFIVDVWTLDQNEWRLRVRFESTLVRAQAR